MILRDDIVTLRPMRRAEDKEYCLSLIRRYDIPVSDDLFVQVKNSFDEKFRYGWIGYSETGIRGGVIYLLYDSAFDRWMLHAYRDDRMLCKLERRRDWSFHAANLVLKFFFEKIWQLQ